MPSISPAVKTKIEAFLIPFNAYLASCDQEEKDAFWKAFRNLHLINSTADSDDESSTEVEFSQMVREGTPLKEYLKSVNFDQHHRIFPSFNAEQEEDLLYSIQQLRAKTKNPTVDDILHKAKAYHVYRKLTDPNKFIKIGDKKTISTHIVDAPVLPLAAFFYLAICITFVAVTLPVLAGLTLQVASGAVFCLGMAAFACLAVSAAMYWKRKENINQLAGPARAALMERWDAKWAAAETQPAPDTERRPEPPYQARGGRVFDGRVGPGPRDEARILDPQQVPSCLFANR